MGDNHRGGGQDEMMVDKTIMGVAVKVLKLTLAIVVSDILLFVLLSGMMGVQYGNCECMNELSVGCAFVGEPNSGCVEWPSFLAAIHEYTHSDFGFFEQQAYITTIIQALLGVLILGIVITHIPQKYSNITWGVLIVFGIIALFGSTERFESADGETIVLHTNDNVSQLFSSEEIVQYTGVNLSDVEVNVLKDYFYCEYHLSQTSYAVYRPDHYIFKPIFSNYAECGCPDDMMYNKDWIDHVQIKLYQPFLGGSPKLGDGWTCTETNCYSSGLTYLGNVSYLGGTEINYKVNVGIEIGGGRKLSGLITPQNPEISSDGITVKLQELPNCTYAAKDIRAFGNSAFTAKDVRNTYIYMQPNFIRNYTYRIEHRDEIVNSIYAMMNRSVPECRVDGDKVICKENTPLFVDIYISED